jgi:HSP20 family molecular chaperone IbpA
MALSRWGGFQDFFDDPSSYAPLQPYWRRNRPWRDDFGLGLFPTDMMTREIRDMERRSRELERQLNREFGELMPAVGKDGFEVAMDVQEFKPNEISVKTDDRFVTIEGKHEERKDPHGYISRHFTRRYSLPEGFDHNTISSELSSDGILKIKAPLPKALESSGSARVVPIQHTGRAALPQSEKKAIETEKK